MASRWGMNRAVHRSETKDLNDSGSSNEHKSIGPKSFSYSELAMATDHFSNNNLLGEGGFGQVYEGRLDGKIRAVKKLKNLPDVHNKGDLEREIIVVNKVSHKNLVKLVGYCIEGANRLLILKYFPNGSLRSKLHGKENVLDWKKRMNIAIGSARGLEYLHEYCKPKIIHLDIKSDNILLDDNFEPKVSDFGLALFFKDASTHISKSSIMGTQVYADPLTTQLGKHSDKSDIYSFGITLLEMITGRNPIDDKRIDIVTWAKPLIEKALDGEYTDFIDSRLQSFDHKEMYRMIFCANICINQPPKFRPSMKMIVLALEGILPLENLYNEKNDNKLRFKTTYKDEPTPSPKPPIIQETNKPSSKPLITQETNRPSPKPPIIQETNKPSPKPLITQETSRPSPKPLITQETSRPSPNTVQETSFDESNQVYKLRRFTYHQLSSATKGFSESNLLYRGTLGGVYLESLNGVGQVIIKKFLLEKEVEFKKIKDISSSVHHKNLINLVGYCDEKDNKLLVYECFTFRSSLSFRLLESTTDWPTSMGIALSIAKGLVHIHELYKPLNICEHFSDDCIFLDNNLEPKFAEYGHAKFFLKDSEKLISNSFTSFTYLKLDVYYFGIILLKIITGKQQYNGISFFNNLIELMASCLKNDWPKSDYSFVDPRFMNYDKHEMDRMIECALACVSPPQHRPEMSKIVEVLEGNTTSKHNHANDNNFPHDNLLQQRMQKLSIIPGIDDKETAEFKAYNPRRFTYQQLQSATQDFSQYVSEGGLGADYKGSLDGQYVAVRRLKYLPDEKLREELNEDIKIICSVNHPNLVRLVGYCIEGLYTFLVLEFFPSNSLKSLLHGMGTLKWSERVKIAINTAKGLKYLHEHFNTIYGDINTNNILIDNNFRPKIANFGLIKYYRSERTDVYTDIEDERSIFKNSDIYAFGVVLLQLITGKTTKDERDGNIVIWAKNRIHRALNGEYWNFIDHKLQSNYDSEEMIRMIYCAAASLYKLSKFRPQIQEIIEVLEGKISPKHMLDTRDMDYLEMLYFNAHFQYITEI